MKHTLALLSSLVAAVSMTSCGPQFVDLSKHGTVSTFNVPYRASPDGSGRSTISPYVGLEHPPGTIGGIYYQNGREYAGGRYETGRFEYRGQYYPNRYYHDGRYIYGGYFRQHARRVSYQR